MNNITSNKTANKYLEKISSVKFYFGFVLNPLHFGKKEYNFLIHYKLLKTWKIKSVTLKYIKKFQDALYKKANYKALLKISKITF